MTSDDDYTICPACFGSGEGQSEGSLCYRCKGSGEIPIKDLGDGEPEVDGDYPLGW